MIEKIWIIFNEVFINCGEETDLSIRIKSQEWKQQQLILR